MGWVTAQQERKRLAEARQDAAKQELVDRTDKEPKSQEHCPTEKEASSEPEQDADWKAAEEQGQEGHGRPAKETDQAPIQEAEQGRCDKTTTTETPKGFQCPYYNLTSSVKLNLRQHIRHIKPHKASKRMYFLIQLKRANVARHELILFYTSCIRQS